MSARSRLKSLLRGPRVWLEDNGIDLLVCILVAITTYRILLPSMNPLFESLRGPQSGSDDGTVLHHANRLAQGDALYRDFFDFQGIFGYVPFSLGFLVGPVTAKTGRIVMYVLMSSWAVVTYLTVRTVTGKYWAGILVALYFPLCVWPTWPQPYQHFIAGLWATCAVLIAVWGERGTLRRGWLIAGVFSGLGLWTSISEGVPALLGLLLCCFFLRYAMRARWHMLAHYLVGLFGLTALLALYLAMRGSLGIAIHDVLVFPFTNYRSPFNTAVAYAGDGPEYVKLWTARGKFEGGVARLLVNMTMNVPKYGTVAAIVVAALLLDRVAHRFYARRVKHGSMPWESLAGCALAASLGSLFMPVHLGYTRTDICHIGFVQHEGAIALSMLWFPISRTQLLTYRWKLVSMLQIISGILVAAFILFPAAKFVRRNAAHAPPKDLDAFISEQYGCPVVRARTEKDDKIVTNYRAYAYFECGRASGISFPLLLHEHYSEDQWPVAAREIAERHPRVLFLPSQDFEKLASYAPSLHALYIGYSGNYMLAQARPGPPWGPSRWRYTIRGPAGNFTRGEIDFRAGPGSPPYAAYIDNRKEGVFTYVDGKKVQIFDGARTFVLERDEHGRTMFGNVFEGPSAQSVEAEISTSPD